MNTNGLFVAPVPGPFNRAGNLYSLYNNNGGNFVFNQGGAPFIYAPISGSADQICNFIYASTSSTGKYQYYIVNTLNGIQKALTSSSTSTTAGTVTMANYSSSTPLATQLWTLTPSGSNYLIQDQFGFYLNNTSLATTGSNWSINWYNV